MRQVERLDYALHAGTHVIKLPYMLGPYEFLILMPEKRDGLAALEREISPEHLAACSSAAKPEHLALTLPKFSLSPPADDVTARLKALGMKGAFDAPPQSADFTLIAPRKDKDHIYISAVFHQTMIEVDERGTTAAAATGAAAGFGRGSGPPPKPRLVRVDHPFLFAIRERESGMLLFLGRMTKL
jgi:serpin B